MLLGSVVEVPDTVHRSYISQNVCVRACECVRVWRVGACVRVSLSVCVCGVWVRACQSVFEMSEL